MARIPSACRTAVLAAVALGSLSIATPVHALTPDQCADITAMTGITFAIVGQENLSVEFRRSLINFLGPKKLCDGPPEIKQITPTDAEAYKAIREELNSRAKIDFDAELVKLRAQRAAAPR